MRTPKNGGGWAAIKYSVKLAFRVGPIRFIKAMRAKNACKTCAYGMGGQLGGMRNEAGHFPEVCKKSMQAMAADMRGEVEPRLFENYSLDQLSQYSSRELELFGRLSQPVIARPGDTHFQVIGWDEALDQIASGMKKATPQRSFFYASGRSSNEAGFLLQLLARAYGTNHVSNCSYYCHQASGVGLKDSIGVSTATIELDDLEKCDLIFLFGANPASNHPRMMSALDRLRRRGGMVVIVNPARELGLDKFRVPSNLRSMLRGSDIATAYLQPTIGGDIGLMIGMAKRLIATGQVDDAFIAGATEGYQEIIQIAASTDWNVIESASGLTRPEIETVAEIYAKSERTVFGWTMGITHHLHGVENVHWIVNLALLRGMVGKIGAGLLPIRGHSNVQGMGTIGVTPAMTQAAVQQFPSLGLTPPSFEGYDTMTAVEASHRGEMDFALCLGGNLFGASPDATHAQEALSKVKTVVYLSTSLNTGHTRGLGQTTIILPVRVRDEEDQSTTQESMFSYVRLSDGGPNRYEGARTEVQILSDLANRVLQKTEQIDWAGLANHDEIRKLIAKLVPNLDPIAKIGQTKQEFHIPGRLIHEAHFPTATGKARFHASPLPKQGALKEHEFRLMTVRSEGQFNTVVYDNEDPYRGQERRDVILMHPLDMQRMGIRVDQAVDVISVAGTMRGILAREFDIARGCALMYYPEANVLVPREVDARSKTPAFKSVIVTVKPSLGQVVTKSQVLESERSRSRERMKAC